MTSASDPSILELEARSERGEPKAHYMLGKRYFEGDGVRQDLVKAAELTRFAAENGIMEAQYTYGYFCCYGLGVPTDKIQAIRWYRKAASVAVPPLTAMTWYPAAHTTSASMRSSNWRSILMRQRSCA